MGKNEALVGSLIDIAGKKIVLDYSRITLQASLLAQLVLKGLQAKE